MRDARPCHPERSEGSWWYPPSGARRGGTRWRSFAALRMTGARVPRPASRAFMSPARLYITPEPADDTVGGTFTLAAELTDLPAAASVEYVLNGRSLSGPVQTAPPFAFRWNSAETWDGPAAFRAVVRDAAGATVAESATLDYTVVNGRTQILVAAPGPGRPLSGTVRITVKARRPDVRVTYREATPPDFSAVAFRLYVDGRIHRHPVTGQTLSVVPAESTDHLWATHTFAIDTTRLANGRHELTFVAEAADERVTTVGSVDITTRYAHPVRMAMAQLAVTVDNGAALREIRPRWRELHLALRGGPTSAALPVRAVYADDSERAIAGGVTYATSDAKVATVSAAGAVKAVAPGEATVTVTALGRTAEVRVRVRATNDFPHFTRDGEIRATIDRGRSVFVRSLFFMDADQFEGREAAPRRRQRHQLRLHLPAHRLDDVRRLEGGLGAVELAPAQGRRRPAEPVPGPDRRPDGAPARGADEQRHQPGGGAGDRARVRADRGERARDRGGHDRRGQHALGARADARDQDADGDHQPGRAPPAGRVPRARAQLHAGSRQLARRPRGLRVHERVLRLPAGRRHARVPVRRVAAAGGGGADADPPPMAAGAPARPPGPAHAQRGRTGVREARRRYAVPAEP